MYGRVTQTGERYVTKRLLSELFAQAGGLREAIMFLIPPATLDAMPGECEVAKFVAVFGEQTLGDLQRLGYVQIGKPAVIPMNVRAYYAQFRSYGKTRGCSGSLPVRVTYENIVSLTWRAWLRVGATLPQPSWVSQSGGDGIEQKD